MKSDREVLQAALNLISRDAGWCKGNYCIDQDGEPADATCMPDISGLSFCIEGAIRYAANYEAAHYAGDIELEEQQVRLQRAVTKAAVASGYKHSPSNRFERNLPRHFNDDPHTSQEDAILACKTALEDLP